MRENYKMGLEQIKNEDFEGCLSIPRYEAKKLRSNSIKVEYFDIIGEKTEKKFNGFYARVF